MSQCLDEQVLLDVLSGRLGREQRDRAMAHIDRCRVCRSVLSTLALAQRQARQPTEKTQSVTPGFPVELGTIGRYRLERELGRGGMAQVFLASLEGPGGFSRRCVLKRLLPELSRDQTQRRLFFAEAGVLSKLEHPHLARVLDFGEVDGQLYLAMDWVDGRDLSSHLADYARAGVQVELPAALELLRQAALGLSAAHTAVDEQGRPLDLVHRDVSPHNLMLSRSGEVKVIDFGLARSSLAEKTAAGLVKGKLRYYSPEQARGEPLDPRTDVFALGLVLYEVLCGRRAYHASSLKELERSAMKGLVPQRNPAPSRIPDGVWALYLRCAAASLERRLPSMSAVVEQVEGLQASAPRGEGRRALAAMAARSPRSLVEGERTQRSGPGEAPAARRRAPRS